MLVKFKIFYYDRGWTARATDHGIVTQGETIGELVDNIIEATELYFEDEIRRGEEITINVTTEPVPDFILELDEIDAEPLTQQFECQFTVDRNAKATGC
jgi:predicted RNase H-like HicB family nuclease